MKIELPNNQYVISERDICDIIIAFNNQDYDWILYFFETLNPIDNIDNQKSPELNAEELRLAVRSIEKITGKFEFEKLLDIVFRDFCIGK